MLPALTAGRFIREFFGARAAALKDILRIHMVYWRQFHEQGCRWDSRRDVVKNSEAEEIEDIQEGDIVHIVTKGNGPFRSRYHLKRSDRRWLICEKDAEIGGIWKGLTSAASDLQLTRPPGQPTQPADTRGVNELGGGQQHRQVERFMNRLFQERTASYAAEAEIYGRQLESFFSPQYDWRRHVASSKANEEEKIESIALVAEGAHVVTRGSYRLRRRYRLHSLNGQWIIQEANHECPMCAERGPNPNCFLCKGTIWNQVRRSNR
ncbi:MAG TPA: hypothetical protein VG938_10765 [Verrucomicrobiae bacterium]|jgi:hypothetical protein|nr:hypothetical protein [Verrucomicrobiae bacterium]